MHAKIVFRTNTRFSMLNRSLLKYDKFINMLKGIFDNGQRTMDNGQQTTDNGREVTGVGGK